VAIPSRIAKFKGLTAIKPNEAEAGAASRIRIQDEASLRRAGRQLLAASRSSYVLVTPETRA